MALKPAIMQPSTKGNLIPDFTSPRWVQDTKVVGTSTLNVDANNPYKTNMTITDSAQGRLIAIPVESGKTYTFSFGNITGLYRLLKGRTDSYNNIPIIGQDQQNKSFTPDDTYGGYVTLRLTHGAAGTYLFENLQLIEGGPAPFSPAKMVNKPAKLISDGALNVPLTSDLWTLRSGTTYKRAEGNRIYFNSNADYAGIQLVLSTMGYNDATFQGKDIVFGGDVHPSATVMFFYKKSDGTPVYIGVSKVTDNGARAMNIPLGSTEHRLYVQSDTGGRGELWCENVYVKFGTDKGYKPYNPTNKKALVYPRKNFFSLDPANWTQGVRQGNKSIQASAYRITYIGDFPKVVPGQNFVLDFPATVPGYSTGHKFGVFVWDINGNVLLDSGWQYGKYEFTIPGGGYEMSLNMGLSNDGSLIPYRAKDTQMITYDKNDMVNKRAAGAIANMIDFTTLTPNMYVRDSDGLVVASGAGLSATDYMEFIEGKRYVIENMPNTFPLVLRFAYYDKNKTFISGTSHYSTVNASKILTAPAGTRYFRTAVSPSDFSTARIYCIDDNTIGDNLGLRKAAFQNLPFTTSRNVQDAKNGMVYARNQPVLQDGGIRVLEHPKEYHATKAIGVIDNVAGSLEFTYIPENDQAYYKQGAINRTYFSTNEGQFFRIWSWGGGSDHIVNFDMRSAANVRTFFDFPTSLTRLEKGIAIKFKISWSQTEFKLWINDQLRMTKTINPGGFHTQPTTSPLYIGYNAATEPNPMSGIYKDVTVRDRNDNIIFKF
ncbi:hypothetical protein CPT_Pookie10 [Bacillus phage Pookie]|uniref:Uncharacterized protein n=1 Tax=Bacillus phage Pookie TaxID=1540093 RepID=A0A0A0RNK7_9CAUD|nr:hypothetical protein CPT_Pookie10 [Bacillus phage Pookie]AIW03695.1 hypothetical protein CPT_Pookie10 [Bacillus phage Pookie]